jgi:hypothetical protein
MLYQPSLTYRALRLPSQALLHLCSISGSRPSGGGTNILRTLSHSGTTGLPMSPALRGWNLPGVMSSSRNLTEAKLPRHAVTRRELGLVSFSEPLPHGRRGPRMRDWP